MRVYIKGLNSCVMRRQKLKQYGDYLIYHGHTLVDAPKQSDVILVWTCAFRQDVKDNSIAELVKYENRYNADVIAAGCLPDIDLEDLKQHFHGKIVSWKDDENQLDAIFKTKECDFAEYLKVYAENKLCDVAEQHRKDNPTEYITFHDQFVKIVISQGCTFSCSYCSERLAFPPYQSFPSADIVEQCKQRIKETNQFDIMFMADSVGEYGSDINSSLPELLHKTIAIDSRIKIALSNLNPASFMQYFDDYLDLIQNNKIAHVNLPIQSASPPLLESMNRTYTAEEIDKIFTAFNDLNFTRFDTHLIVGFPGETETDIQTTIDFILKHRFGYILVSRFMEAPKIEAANLPDKVDDTTFELHINLVRQSLGNKGIILNVDDSSLMQDRFARLNR